MLRFHADFKGNDHACERKVSEFHGGWVKRERERRRREREREEKGKKFLKKKRKKEEIERRKKMEEERCGGRGLGAIACSSTVSLKE